MEGQGVDSPRLGETDISLDDPTEVSRGGGGGGFEGGSFSGGSSGTTLALEMELDL